jgi:hypothetical protein
MIVGVIRALLVCLSGIFRLALSLQQPPAVAYGKSDCPRAQKVLAQLIRRREVHTVCQFGGDLAEAQRVLAASESVVLHIFQLAGAEVDGNTQQQFWDELTSSDPDRLVYLHAGELE